jgi:hypothetical protein
MRKLLILIVVIASLGTGVALATGSSGGETHQNAGNHQYKPQPGCGPWKTDGVAGNSGYHDGQPPKSPGREDCPDPGDDCKGENENESSKAGSRKSSSRSSSTHSGYNEECGENGECSEKSSSSKSSSSKSSTHSGYNEECGENGECSEKSSSSKSSSSKSSSSKSSSSKSRTKSGSDNCDEED